MCVWTLDAATYQRELMVWLTGLELDGTAANRAVSRKSHQARPAVIVMPEHFQLAAGFFERGHPVRGFDDTVINDAEPR